MTMSLSQCQIETNDDNMSNTELVFVKNKIGPNQILKHILENVKS